jgi:SAM-dependent methyltransferase
MPDWGEGCCPACGSGRLQTFYEVEAVPVHTVRNLPTREAALKCPTADVLLGFCRACGFISNLRFDPQRLDYSAGYEPTQAFSSTFSAFHRQLATHLIERYDLHGKDIIEIGCGQGEFLILLCEMGGNRGVGFDPIYTPGRAASAALDRITFVRDYYAESYRRHRAHLVCCKMTLEHVHPVAHFVCMVRRCLQDQPNTVVFFQMPDVWPILGGLEFWNIYYEHCSYFSPGSLGRLFRRCGFDVLDLWRGFDDQYLMIEARPGGRKPTPALAQEADLEELAQAVAYFATHHQAKLEYWEYQLTEAFGQGRRVVLWGGSSRAVALLTRLRTQREVEYVVDINPYRQGTYLAGTGQQIVAPEFLRQYRPDVVIAMNPIYRDEIKRDLERLGVQAELLLLC